MQRTAYQILGVHPCDGVEVIKKMFRRASLINHPDRGGDPEDFDTIKKAYNTLIGDRRAYDAELRFTRSVCLKCDGDGVVREAKSRTGGVNFSECQVCMGVGYHGCKR